MDKALKGPTRQVVRPARTSQDPPAPGAEGP
jgi:hypothetical protein